MKKIFVETLKQWLRVVIKFLWESVLIGMWMKLGGLLGGVITRKWTAYKAMKAAASNPTAEPAPDMTAEPAPDMTAEPLTESTGQIVEVTDPTVEIDVNVTETNLET